MDAAEHVRPELGEDEIRMIAAAADDVETVITIAALSHSWRAVAVAQLSSNSTLRPGSHALQQLATGLKSKDPTFVTHVPLQSCIAVCESSLHRIVLISTLTGERIRTMGKFGWAPGPGLNYPKGIAADEAAEHLFVCDRSNHRVLKMQLSDGAILASCGHDAGARGNGERIFRYPQGLAYTRTKAYPSGVVFVCDYGNGRLVALDALDLSWGFSFGEQLASDTDMPLPAGCVASATQVVVVDVSRHCLHAFSAVDGAHLRTLCTEGELEYPWGVCYLRAGDEHRLVIAEGAASGGRRGSLQVVCADSGRTLQVIEAPSAGRLSGVCAEASSGARRIFVVDNDARCVRVLTSAWREEEEAGGQGSPRRSRALPSVTRAGEEGAAVTDTGFTELT